MWLPNLLANVSSRETFCVDAVMSVVGFLLVGRSPCLVRYLFFAVRRIDKGSAHCCHRSMNVRRDIASRTRNALTGD